MASPIGTARMPTHGILAAERKARHYRLPGGNAPELRGGLDNRADRQIRRPRGYRRDFEKARILASHVAGVSTRINRTGRGDDPTFSVRVVACPMLGEAILRTRKRVRPESGKPTPCRWSR